MAARADIPPTIRSIIEAGRSAPSADNSQPWRFCWDGNRLAVNYDKQRVSGKTFGPNEHATLLAVGAVKENILQMANFLNVEAEEVHFNNSGPYFQFELRFSGKEILPMSEHPIFQRHTNRWPYNSKSIPAEVCESLKGISHGQCHALIFGDTALKKNIASWVRTASEIRFQSHDVHEFLGRSLRFNSEEVSQGDGLDVRTLPLPPGGRAFLRLIKDWDRMRFLNRLGCYKLLAMMEAKPVSDAANMLLIVGPDSPNDTLDAGRLMERVWIYLNARGIAVHPYYVITDQLQRLKTGRIVPHLRSSIEGLQSEIRTVFNAGHGMIHMLLRIGHPTEHPIRSLRLPSEKVTELIDP
jgi:hypothetical protein